MPNHRSMLAAVLAAFALMSVAPGAGAVDWGMSEGTLEDLSHDATQSLLIGEVLRERGRSGGPAGVQRPDREASDTLAIGGAANQAVRKLAARHPPAERREVERALGDLLQRYRQIERQFGIRPGDVAGAVAAYVAGGLMAYRNEGFPDAHFKPLVDQMRDLLLRERRFVNASADARREMYEQFAILGMSMAAAQMSLQRRPDLQGENRMRAAARAQLRRFLGVDPDRVTISAQGLVIR